MLRISLTSKYKFYSSYIKNVSNRISGSDTMHLPLAETVDPHPTLCCLPEVG